MSVRNALESYHDAQQALDMALNLFNGGYLPLDQRCEAENALLGHLREAAAADPAAGRGAGGSPEPRRDAGRHLLLQLLAVPVDARQLGDQAAVPGDADPPARTSRRRSHAVLGDITCDSDGKIDQFIDRRDVKRTLPLHTSQRRTRTTWRVFLLGAYQEILGDMHNLFGDTHAVHVTLDDQGEVVLDAVIKGDTVREVLQYVDFNTDALVAKLRTDVETAVRDRRMTYEESGRLLKFYEEGLGGYTYLE